MEPQGSLPHSQTFATFPILGQPNPVHIPTFHLLEIHPNIIHTCRPRSPQWSLSLRFPHQDLIHPLSPPIRATCPAHLILFDFITRTILGEQYKSFSSSFLHNLHRPKLQSSGLFTQRVMVIPFLGFLTLADGTYRLSRNVSKELLLHAALIAQNSVVLTYLAAEVWSHCTDQWKTMWYGLLRHDAV